MTEPVALDEACVMSHPDTQRRYVGLLCRRHRWRMDEDADEIAALILDTDQIRDGGAPRDSGPRGKQPKKRADPPAPGDVTIMALFDRRTKVARIPASDADPMGDQSEPFPDVLTVVASWVLLVAEERQLTEIRTRRVLTVARNRAVWVDVPYTAPRTLPSSVIGQLDFLKQHHGWLAAQPWVDDYLTEMGDIRKALRAVVNDEQFTRRGTCRLPLEQSICGGTLLEENGTRAVVCTRCRARWVTDQELARLAVALEDA